MILMLWGNSSLQAAADAAKAMVRSTLKS